MIFTLTEKEVEMMAELNSKQELKELAEAHGMDKNQIKKLL